MRNEMSKEQLVTEYQTLMTKVVWTADDVRYRNGLLRAMKAHGIAIPTN